MGDIYLHSRTNILVRTLLVAAKRGFCRLSLAAGTPAQDAPLQTLPLDDAVSVCARAGRPTRLMVQGWCAWPYCRCIICSGGSIVTSDCFCYGLHLGRQRQVLLEVQ